MSNHNSFQAALSAHNIPIPHKEIREDRFTRWGKNMEFFAKKVGEGYVFGNWKIGLSTYWFPTCKEQQNNKYRRFSR